MATISIRSLALDTRSGTEGGGRDSGECRARTAASVLALQRWLRSRDRLLSRYHCQAAWASSTASVWRTRGGPGISDRGSFGEHHSTKQHDSEMYRGLVGGEQSPVPIALQRQYQPSHQGYRAAIPPWQLALLEEASMPLRATLLLENPCPNSSRINLLRKAKGTSRQMERKINCQEPFHRAGRSGTFSPPSKPQ